MQVSLREVSLIESWCGPQTPEPVPGPGGAPGSCLGGKEGLTCRRCPEGQCPGGLGLDGWETPDLGLTLKDPGGHVPEL